MVLEQKYPVAPLKVRMQFHESRGLYEASFFALGTNCRILFAAASPQAAQDAVRGAIRWLGEFEAMYSRFRDTSLISEINRQAGGDWVPIPKETERLFALCDDLQLITHGILDPTMHPLVALWDHRLPHDRLPTEAEIEVARAKVGWSRVQRRPGAVRLPEAGMALDFGGFGKEYAVDTVSDLLAAHGVAASLVDLGADIFARGTPPDSPSWHVALEDPQRRGQAGSSVAVDRKGVATSGDYCRFFEYQKKRYGHIIDPRSGYPVRNSLLSVSVVACSCLQAGILSTTAFVLGVEEGLQLVEDVYGSEALIFLESGMRQTRGFLNYEVNQ